MLCRSDRAPRNRSSRFPRGNPQIIKLGRHVQGLNLRCAARHATRGIRLESRVLRSRNRSAVVSSANDCINAPHPIHDTRVPCIRPLAAGAWMGMDQQRRRDTEYCFSELPRIRSAVHDSRLGRSAQPGRASVHGDGAMAGTLAWSMPDHYRLQSQHVRRRHAGPARPEAAWRDHAHAWWRSARCRSRQLAGTRTACGCHAPTHGQPSTPIRQGKVRHGEGR